MKTRKIILISLISLFYVSVNAQVFVGGNFSINLSGGTHDNGTTTINNPAVFGMHFTPQFGKSLSEKVAVGIGLDFDYTRSKTDGTPETIDQSSTIGISPFLRYYAIKWNKISLFGQGSVDLSFSGSSVKTGATSVDGPKNTNIGFNVVPALAYDITEKLSLETFINVLRFSYSYNVSKSGNNTDTHSNFNIGAGLGNIVSVGNISIGAIYKF
jgi:hypothetical protein